MAKLFNVEQEFGIRGVRGSGANVSIRVDNNRTGALVGQAANLAQSVGGIFNSNVRNQRAEGKFISGSMERLRGIRNEAQFRREVFNLTTSANKQFGSEGGAAVSAAIKQLTAPTVEVQGDTLFQQNFLGERRELTTPTDIRGLPTSPHAEGAKRQGQAFRVNLPNTNQMIDSIIGKVNAEREKKGISSAYGTGPENASILQSQNALLDSIVKIRHFQTKIAEAKAMSGDLRQSFNGEAFKASAGRQIKLLVDEAMLSLMNPELLESLRSMESINENDFVQLASSYFNDLTSELSTNDAFNVIGIDPAAIATMRNEFIAGYSAIGKAMKDREQKDAGFKLAQASARIQLAMLNARYTAEQGANLPELRAEAERAKLLLEAAFDLRKLVTEGADTANSDSMRSALNNGAKRANDVVTGMSTAQNLIPGVERQGRTNLGDAENVPEEVLARGKQIFTSSIDTMITASRPGDKRGGRANPFVLMTMYPRVKTAVENLATQMKRAIQVLVSRGDTERARVEQDALNASIRNLNAWADARGLNEKITLLDEVSQAMVPISVTKPGTGPGKPLFIPIGTGSKQDIRRALTK